MIPVASGDRWSTLGSLITLERVLPRRLSPNITDLFHIIYLNGFCAYFLMSNETSERKRLTLKIIRSEQTNGTCEKMLWVADTKLAFARQKGKEAKVFCFLLGRCTCNGVSHEELMCSREQLSAGLSSGILSYWSRTMRVIRTIDRAPLSPMEHLHLHLAQKPLFAHERDLWSHRDTKTSRPRLSANKHEVSPDWPAH